MANEALVTRTYRAAIRVGEDYYTIEETISLPPGASDDEIAAALDTSMRIYQSQQAAIEAQIQQVRDTHPAGPVRILDPEAPASDKQRSYLEYLVNTLQLSDEHMERVLREHQTSYDTLTKGAASEIIDQLKHEHEAKSEPKAEVKAPAEAPAPKQQALGGAAASARQLAALERVAGQFGVDLASEIQSRFGAQELEELSSAEAGALLQELQQRGSRR